MKINLKEFVDIVGRINHEMRNSTTTVKPALVTTSIKQ
jgi:hypothetical protein